MIQTQWKLIISHLTVCSRCASAERKGGVKGGEGSTGQKLCSAHLLGPSAQGWSLQSAGGERSILVEVTRVDSHISLIKTWSHGHA